MKTVGPPPLANPMKPTTAEELANRAVELMLVGPGDVHAAWAEVGGHNVPIEALGAALLRQELLTSYQLERLLRGDRQGFFYGSAKILYQVGAGSFARVYRAKHVETGDLRRSQNQRIDRAPRCRHDHDQTLNPRDSGRDRVHQNG